MRVEEHRVALTNVFGNEVTIHIPHPSNEAQDYDLKVKNETKDCSKCPCNIPRDEALQLIDLGTLAARSEWVPPDGDTVKGVCVWGVSPKILVERAKARHCGLLKKSE